MNSKRLSDINWYYTTNTGTNVVHNTRLRNSRTRTCFVYDLRMLCVCFWFCFKRFNLHVILFPEQLIVSSHHSRWVFKHAIYVFPPYIFHHHGSQLHRPILGVDLDCDMRLARWLFFVLLGVHVGCVNVCDFGWGFFSLRIFVKRYCARNIL